MKVGAGAIVLALAAVCALLTADVFVSAQPGPPGSGSGYGPIQTMFDQACVRCHGGATPARGLSLQGASSYDHIVNVPSTELPGMNRITPGDPDHSYLFLKVTDRHVDAGGRGRRCPLGQPPLPPDRIEQLEGWIRDGAPR